MISGTCVILHSCTAALLSNRLSSVPRLALGSELSQNFAGLATFSSSPTHKEPQPLESDIQKAGLYSPPHLSVSGDHTSLCPLSLLLALQSALTAHVPLPRWHSALPAVQGPLWCPGKFPNGLIFNLGGVGGITNPTIKNKQAGLVSFCSCFPPPLHTGTPNSTFSMVREDS